MKLLKSLCQIFAPSGNEGEMTQFILDYVQSNQSSWKSSPEIVHIQDCIILRFGNPRTAVFAHIDSIGFTVRYQDQLVPIGSPVVKTGYELVGEDSLGPVDCTLKIDEDGMLSYDFGRAIETGTELVFKCDFKETKSEITSCYLDNRLGVYNALRLAETTKDGAIVFSCLEEHGGGTVPFLAKYLHENWAIKQALISDITWVTDGVHPGKGVVISLRDRNIPRKSFLKKILLHANASGIPYQLEVEGSGSSDGREIQESPYPIDWCFIGAPEKNVHSPYETVSKPDINSMIEMYQWLIEKL